MASGVSGDFTRRRSRSKEWEGRLTHGVLGHRLLRDDKGHVVGGGLGGVGGGGHVDLCGALVCGQKTKMGR